MKKKILILIVLFLLVGCMKKDVVSVEKFESILKENNFSVIDITKEINNDGLENFIVATNNNYQIEFLVFKSNESAINSYDSYMDLVKKDSYESIEEKGNNYHKSSLKNNEHYVFISRIENTTIYSKVSIEYENELNNILKKLGY